MAEKKGEIALSVNNKQLQQIRDKIRIINTADLSIRF
jgi:hypothetical protein